MLIYIEKDLKIDGAVLIFLPGWAWISELHDHLQKNIFIGNYYFFYIDSCLGTALNNHLFLNSL